MKALGCHIGLPDGGCVSFLFMEEQRQKKLGLVRKKLTDFLFNLVDNRSDGPMKLGGAIVPPGMGAIVPPKQ